MQIKILIELMVVQLHLSALVTFATAVKVQVPRICEYPSVAYRNRAVSFILWSQGLGL